MTNLNTLLNFIQDNPMSMKLKLSYAEGICNITVVTDKGIYGTCELTVEEAAKAMLRQLSLVGVYAFDILGHQAKMRIE